MLSNQNGGNSSLRVSAFFFFLEKRRYINRGGLGYEKFGKSENFKSLLPLLILTIQCVLYIKKKICVYVCIWLCWTLACGVQSARAQ